MVDTEKPKRGRPPKYTEEEKKEKYAEASRLYYNRNKDKYLQRSAEKYRAQIGNQYTYSSKNAKALSSTPSDVLNILTRIRRSELEDYGVQVIAVAVDYTVKDNSYVSDLMLHDEGTIKLCKSPQTGKRCIAMFGILPHKNYSKEQCESYFQSCLSKIEKIRNLKSIAFSKELLEHSNYKELLENFATDLPNVKVYVYSA